MAEVGEVDHLLDEIMISGMDDLPAEQQLSIFERFYQEALKQQQSESERLNLFHQKPDSQVMIALSDSNKRWENFNRLWKCHEKLKTREKIGNYKQDVLDPRNSLAHGKPIVQADGSYLFYHRSKEFRFDDAVSLNLRQTILKYKRAFTEILNALHSG